MTTPNAFRADSARIPFASIDVRHSTSLNAKIGPKAPSIVEVCNARGRHDKRMGGYAAFGARGVR